MVETASSPNGSGHGHGHGHRRRWIPSPFSFLYTHKAALTAFWIVFFFIVFHWNLDAAPGGAGGGGLLAFRRVAIRPVPRLRPVAFNLTDFGGFGDGRTLNTAAFERAMMAISSNTVDET